MTTFFRPGATLAASLLTSLVLCAADIPEKITVPSLNLVMVKIHPGTFVMGNTKANGDDDEGPAHQATLTREFWLGATTVTVGQFRQFIEATGYVTEPEINNTGIFVKRDDVGPQKYTNWRNPATPNLKQTDDHPVVGISWKDTQQFCAWLTDRERAGARLPVGHIYRLPTEAQWEYAAKAGTTEDLADPSDYAWYVGNSGGVPHPVGLRKPNPWGLYDMQGNVWVWVHDWYGRYPATPVVDPEGPSSPADPAIIRPLREMRGGTWNDPFGHGLNTPNRWGTWGIYASNWVSFRVAIGLPPSPIPSSRRPVYPPDSPVAAPARKKG
ncbi:MAG: hypothetical protein EXS38_01595 [Opitutus sp.]|nr:hypothetical protein [Opitutus sp.]